MHATICRLIWSAALLLIFLVGQVCAEVEGAGSLLAAHAKLEQQLSDNPFGRPLHLESEEDNSRLFGEIYAEIPYPFSVASKALQNMGDWCDVLILHLNTKSCRANPSQAGDTLSLHIGRKHPQKLSSAKLVDFDYAVIDEKTDYLEVMLDAEKGPMGTSQYRIVLKMTPLNSNTSFLHLTYSYRYNLMAKVAMEGYLTTLGRDKVGFSVAGHDDQGKPEYVQGMRAVVERNTMRYYLAIEAYLDSLSVPPKEQIERRLNDWFDRSEEYATQLREIGREEYLTMKQHEIQRQSDSARYK